MRLGRVTMGFLVALAHLFAANEARAQFFYFDYSTGTGDPKEWVAYGDSIIAGYCGIFCFPRVKSYAAYFADAAAATNGWAIHLSGFPNPGETTIQIYDEMATTHNAELRAADAIIWSAGGNDFLDARSAYISSCATAGISASRASMACHSSGIWNTSRLTT